MKRKRSLILTIIGLTLVLFNITSFWGVNCAHTFTYSIEEDETYSYECTYAKYKDGSEEDPYKNHPVNIDMVRIIVSSVDLNKDEGDVKIDGWYLDAGDDDWQQTLDDENFEFNSGDLNIGTSFYGFKDGEVTYQHIVGENGFFDKTPFFIPSNMSEEDWGDLRKQVGINLDNAFTGMPGVDDTDDITELVNETQIRGYYFGPTNDYNVLVDYDEEGILNLFDIWIESTDAEGYPVRHTVIKISKIEYNFDFGETEEEQEKRAQNIIIGVTAGIAAVFVIWYRRRNA